MKWIGNLFIISSISVFVFLYYPIAKIYFFPPEITDVKNRDGFYITIPKIHAQAPVIANVDPYNHSLYSDSLKKGVAHSNTSSLPDEKGTVFIFAHSSGPPWEITRYNTVFFRLRDLDKGDEIQVDYNRKNLTYKVFDKKIVDPSEVKYLQGEADILVLQTCYPLGTSLKRLLIFAKKS